MPAHFSARTASTSQLLPAALVGLVMAFLGALMTTAPAQGAVSAPAAARVAMAGETGDAVTVATHEYARSTRAASRLSVTKAPYGSTGWTFGGRLTRAGKPYARQRVQIWIRLNGSWTNFEETKRTNDRGRVSWHTGGSLGKNSYVFQLRYPGNAATRSVRSTTFRLQGR